MKIVAVIPMKLNNQRLPGKNIKEFSNGVPMCSYILNRALKIKLIDEVYVYCSDEAIQAYIPHGVFFLKRDKKLDENNVIINEILACFSKKVEADVYILLHTTAPFISKKSIEKGLRAIIEEKYDSAFAVIKHQDFYWINGKANYSLDKIPRTQDLEPIYFETSGFYAFTKDVIENGRRVGEKPYMVEVNSIEATDVDDIEDFKYADLILKNNLYKEGEI